MIAAAKWWMWARRDGGRAKDTAKWEEQLVPRDAGKQVMGGHKDEGTEVVRTEERVL